MRQKVFLAAFAVVFSLLVGVQSYFFLVPDAGIHLRADRIGASLLNPLTETEKAGEEIDDLSVYLTVETEGDAPANASLIINDTVAGNFSKGILCVKVVDGDVLKIRSSDRIVVTVTDYPENLNEASLPPSFTAKKGVTAWGTIIFK
ncbi:MAG TPA: hypothetical protein PKD52_06155 [Clostridiales bacterium]|nr:hypothetical protein [Clostridiales bacterium]